MEYQKELRFISLLSDYGFKVAFADESDTAFLRKALQATIKCEHEIQKVEFIRNELRGLTFDSRGGVCDLICRDELGRYFIVEMQLRSYKNFIHRSKFYAFHRFNTLVQTGKYFYEDLPQIYCISFLAFDLYPKSEEFYHFGTLKNQKGEKMDDQIVHIIVEISKFDKELNELESDLDKLLYLMKNLQHVSNTGSLRPPLTAKWVSSMVERLNRSRLTADERADLEMSLAREASIRYSIEQERIEAVKEAVDEVKEAARTATKEAARTAAKEAARIATREAEIKAAREVEEAELQIAKNLKKMGVAFAVIVASTGLSAEEIDKL